MKATLFAALIAGFLSGALGSAQSDLARELEQAKSLYKSANFVRALQALGAVVRLLDERTDVPNAEAMRVDGYLHLGLTYFALQDAEAAKESFKKVLTLRPNFALDANQYPPRVRTLFEDARAETVVRPGPRPTPPPRAAPAPAPNRLQILYDNWPVVAPLDGDEKRITREDLEIFRSSPDAVKRQPDLAEASAFLLDNPTFFDRADVGKGSRYNLGGSSDIDGEISADDLRACLEWGARGPLGRFDPGKPTPETAAQTFLHWFELLDIGAGRGEIDGVISYRDLREFVPRNPGAPAELRQAVTYVLENRTVLSQFDSAADDDGEVDEEISLEDLERVK